MSACQDDPVPERVDELPQVRATCEPSCRLHVVNKETVSGASANRAALNRVLDLAQARQIDAILVSELSRWGRSTQDGIDTLNRLAGWKVSVVAMNWMTFELDTPHGRMMATKLAGIAQFERDLLSERVKSSLAAAQARGKKLGRQPGQRPKSDRLAPPTGPKSLTTDTRHLCGADFR